MGWEPQYPVNFTPDGDTTSQAIEKHIKEISRIYDLLNLLHDWIQNISTVTNADGSVAQSISISLDQNIYLIRFEGSHTSSVTWTVSYSSDGNTYTTYKTIDGTDVSLLLIADNEDGSCNYIKLEATAGAAEDTVNLAIATKLLFEKPF
ncbi:MAG: hypothetical protein DRP34_00620 [Thermodesulfobacteriota bacterium]|nr:MAG: hypothetical protein DRP34_00620 [Thermodesulfobacteriota bacterium]